MQAESKNKEQTQVGNILGVPKANVGAKSISGLKKSDVVTPPDDDRDAGFVIENPQDSPMSSEGVLGLSLTGDVPPPHFS